MELLRTLSRNRTAVGYFLIVVSTVCFSVNNNLAKESYAYGVSVDIMLVGRSWTLTVLLGCWFAFRGVRPTVPRGLGPLVLICIVMFSLNAWSLLSAFDLMPVSLAILIFYLFPFLVSLLAAVLGIERLKPVMMIGLLVAFGGLVLTLDSSGDLNAAGVVLSLVAALAIAGNILTSGRLLRSGMSSVALSFWVMVGASVIFTLSLLVTGIDAEPISTTGWLVFHRNGPFCRRRVHHILYGARLPERGPDRAGHEPGTGADHYHRRVPVCGAFRRLSMARRRSGLRRDHRRHARQPADLGLRRGGGGKWRPPDIAALFDIRSIRGYLPPRC